MRCAGSGYGGPGDTAWDAGAAGRSHAPPPSSPLSTTHNKLVNNNANGVASLVPRAKIDICAGRSPSATQADSAQLCQTA
ncbi:hypothetical protein Q1695_016439 [Nippostrongylus brasiliensis]|nr:hypothetical protein Q1695_016439 [Nippostrongylus brasiliensis]